MFHLRYLTWFWICLYLCSTVSSFLIQLLRALVNALDIRNKSRNSLCSWISGPYKRTTGVILCQFLILIVVTWMQLIETTNTVQNDRESRQSPKREVFQVFLSWLADSSSIYFLLNILVREYCYHFHIVKPKSPQHCVNMTNYGTEQ